eukprot:scaffold52989_cov21-Tisochrysis_lutea.AAC.2
MSVRATAAGPCRGRQNRRPVHMHTYGPCIPVGYVYSKATQGKAEQGVVVLRKLGRESALGLSRYPPHNQQSKKNKIRGNLACQAATRDDC